MLNKFQKDLEILSKLLEVHATKIAETETCLGYQVKTYRLNNSIYLVTVNRNMIIDISRYE